MNKFLTLVALVLLLQGISGCMFFTPKTYKNEDIDQDTRTEMTALNKKLFNAIMTKNIKVVKSLMSPTLVDTAGKKIDTVVNSMADIYHAKNYRTLGEFYTVHSSLLHPTKLVVNDSSFTSFNVEYRAIKNDEYMVIMVSKNLAINCSVMAVYGKYDSGWKVNLLEIGGYEALGKTAPTYYTEAMEKFKKGDTVDAAMLIITAAEIGNPGGKYIKYNNIDDMQEFYRSTVADANSQYHFPITVKQIRTEPRIFTVTPLIDTAQNDLCPVVKYITKIKLSDTTALRAENMAMQKIIGHVFKGLDEDKKRIAYRAYNQMPDGKTEVNRFTFIQKLN